MSLCLFSPRGETKTFQDLLFLHASCQNSIFTYSRPQAKKVENHRLGNNLISWPKLVLTRSLAWPCRPDLQNLCNPKNLYKLYFYIGPDCQNFFPGRVYTERHLHHSDYLFQKSFYLLFLVRLFKRIFEKVREHLEWSVRAASIFFPSKYAQGDQKENVDPLKMQKLLLPPILSSTHYMKPLKIVVKVWQFKLLVFSHFLIFGRFPLARSVALSRRMDALCMVTLWPK